MKMTHRLNFPLDRVSIKTIKEAIARYNIPDDAEIFESGEDYCITIEWLE